MSWRFPERFTLSKLRQAPGLGALLVGLAVGAMVVGLDQMQAWTPLENLASTVLMRLRGPQPWDERIVIVGIDDKTLRQLEQFPLPRTYYAALLNRLSDAGAAVVAFDLLLAEPTPEDAVLAEAMLAQGGAVLAVAWGGDGRPVNPVPVLANSAIALGHIHQELGSDGVARRLHLQLGSIPTLSVAAVQAYSLVADLVPIPSQPDLLLNWPGPRQNIAYVSLVDVLEGRADPAVFSDKIVLVGATATGFDQIRTPFNPDESAEGVYVHAAALHNLLQQNWLRSPPPLLVALALLTAGPLASWSLRRFEFRLQVGLWLVASAGWVLVCLVALHHNQALPIVPPLLVLGMSEGVIALHDRLRTNALLQARSEFLSTMSHEIRTPLNAIVGVSEMLQETQLTAKQREFADTLHTSSQALLALINDVLDFSKIEAGKLVLEQHPVNLRTCIEQSLDIVAPRAIGKNLELVYAIDPATPSVIISDPVRLRQILLNLLNNAVKFTDSGEVALHVRPVQASPPPSPRRTISNISRLNGHGDSYAIQFSVRDTGIGIPADRLGKLFQPFSQVSASTTRKYGGTGLGLAISQRLAETFNGRLWVESEVGKGSVFSFVIEAVPEPTPAGQVLPQGLTIWADQSCLIVDGNLTRRTSLEWQLQALGVRPLPVRSVAEALVLVQQGQQFAAVILDASVAKVDNISAIEALRDSADWAALPIILMSTLAEPSQTLPQQTFVIWKPIKQAALYRTLLQISGTGMNRAVPSLQATAPLLAPGQKSLKILVADDNPINQRVAQHLLELLGYGSDVVSNGYEVMEALQRQTYDVVFMDMRMPGMDGVETTRRIRQQGQRLTQPWIVAMTANALAEDRHHCLSAGMNDYLSKPIRREMLSQVLSKLQPA